MTTTETVTIAAFAAECAVEAIELEVFDPSAHTAEITMGLQQAYTARFGTLGDGWDLVFCPVFEAAVAEARRRGRLPFAPVSLQG